jgi:hypothetical protein
MAYDKTYQISGEMGINTRVKPQSDVISDIRSIEGITIVTFSPKNENDSSTDNRNHRGILSVKFDTFPFTEFDKETQVKNLVELIRQMPAVNYFRPNKITLLENTQLKSLIKEALQEKKVKRDRCLRIADRKFDKPSAYKSGAVVRCRRGEIWKDLKEAVLSSLTNINPYNDPDDEYAQDLDSYLLDDNVDWKKESYITLLDPNKIEPSEWNQLQTDVNNSKSVKYSKMDPKTVPPILALKTGPNSYEAIDGIHRVYAFRLNKHMLPAIVISPKLDRSLATNDTQMVNFMFNKYKDSNIPTPTPINLQEDESLHKWFKRQGAPGKEGGWVDCNAPIRKDGEITGYKPCGRKKGEERSKYPSCRPTASGCKDKGKGKTWGKTK